MATERNPFDDEQELAEETEEELLLLLALALIYSTQHIKLSSFKFSDIEEVNNRFREKMSNSILELTRASQSSIEMGLKRASKDLGLKGLSVDFNDPAIRGVVQEVLERHLDFIVSTNNLMYNKLREIALDSGWTDEEFARRFKKLSGLTSRHMQSVLNMEKALIKEGVPKKKRDKKIQQRIDQLIEWRFNLIATQISTEIMQASKDASYSYLVSTGQVDIAEYEKQWVSVIDDVTTDICTSLHLSRAEIGKDFKGTGVYHPPAYPPLHMCRSSIRLVKKVL